MRQQTMRTGLISKLGRLAGAGLMAGLIGAAALTGWAVVAHSDEGCSNTEACATEYSKRPCNPRLEDCED